MSTKIIPFLLVIVVLLLTGCGGAAEAESADGRLQVVTTIGQIADAARIIGGDHVRVTSLMGAGTDPHLYVASISDVDKLRGADVVFYNGLYLEAQLEDVLEQLAERQSVVAVSAGIDPAGLMPSADYADEFDPHIWFDVALWSQAVAQVRDTLSQIDPAHAADYEANAAAYLAELAALDAYVAEQAARVPAEQRVLITAHDAFNYFGRAYDFEVLGLQGISTASEAGDGRRATTVRLYRRPAHPGDLHRVIRARAQRRGRPGRRAQPWLRRRHRRSAFLRRHGRHRHAGRNLRRHGAA
jgi:manganese/zinc/iron transport system substrate-binding protein